MRKTYAGKEVDVSFDPEVCIHAAKCVRGMPVGRSPGEATS